MACIAPLGPVYQAGTLSGNPIAVAAGLATLKVIEPPEFFVNLSAATRMLIDGLTTAATTHDVAFSAQAVGGMFGLYFRASPPADYQQVMECDVAAFNRFFHAMLDEGIYFAPSAFEAGFVSAAHGKAEIEKTLAAARAFFARVA
jgi:glutamate-1-semialdehyde 2,1-aminomutase